MYAIIQRNRSINIPRFPVNASAVAPPLVNAAPPTTTKYTGHVFGTTRNPDSTQLAVQGLTVLRGYQPHLDVLAWAFRHKNAQAGT